MDTPVVFGQSKLTIEDVISISLYDAKTSVSNQADFVKLINTGAECLDTMLADDGYIYGVTTGYGESVSVHVPEHLVPELPIHLTRFHGCGLGDNFTIEEGRAILACRLISLCQGYSGVSYSLLHALNELLTKNIIPIIPQEGSVGASGDLTPLSYVAGTLIGERNVYYNGREMSAKEAFKLANIDHVVLRPKEGLALMNGTAVMTALACIAFHRAEYLAKLATRITAMVCMALKGNSYHFDEMLFIAKPHLGQQRVAAGIRDDLSQYHQDEHEFRLQDRYSLRCAPHVIGVLSDSLDFYRTQIENELNSANDNPLIDIESKRVLHGGNFYGGHIAMVMDNMKTAVANIADLLDRQLAMMVDTKFNNGLPANLSSSKGEYKHINHGFKAVQIGASSFTAEALKLTMPASVFSRSTECHNQDKVSMGTIAARDALRVIQLTEQVIACTLLASIQAINIRLKSDDLQAQQVGKVIQELMTEVGHYFAELDEDRPLEHELRTTINNIQSQAWALYE